MKSLLVCAILSTSVLPGALRADDEAEARTIIDDAIAAHGGRKALERITGMYFKVRGFNYGEDEKTPVSFESWFQGQDKFRAISYDDKGKVDGIEVVSGKQGWEKDDKGDVEKMSDEKFEFDQELIYLNWATMLTPLSGKEFKVTTTDDSNVAGRPASGVLVTDGKHAPLKLYFDKESHLLVKYEHKIKVPGEDKRVLEEGVYSDFRHVQDLKQAFKLEEFWDGDKVSDLEVSDQKWFDKPLEDKLFEKP